MEPGPDKIADLETTHGVKPCFQKPTVLELHALIHERLELLLRHVATVPDDLTRKPILDSGIRPSGNSLFTSILA
jgi:hypothetical protein